MKRILLITLPLLVVLGGVAGALYFLGMPPFRKAVRKLHKAASITTAGQRPAVSAPVLAAAAAPPSPPAARRTAPHPPPQVTASLDVDEQEEARIARLSSVYEQMPAEEAGRIFAKLPDPLVEKLLRKMDERQVGKLLLVLDTNRAVRLTQSLAK